MVTFNFFEDSATELVEKFCIYYRLDSETVADYFATVNPDTLIPEVLVRKFGLKLEEYDSSELQIVCRHMTTGGKDDLESFMKKGILDLRSMLQEETPLSAFLSTHKIKVLVDEHRIEVNGKTYPILENHEQCEECYNGRDRICMGFSKCKSYEELSHLAMKLYFYGATVECFIHATLDEMKRYSTLENYPEILNTLDKVYSAVNGQFSTAYKLSYDWIEKKKNCYVLEYASKWFDMETFAPISYSDAYSEYKSLLNMCGYDYSDYMERVIPKRVYDNIIFLKKFVSIYFYDSEEYGSLLPRASVAPEAVTIYQVNGDNLVKVIR